MKMTGIVVLPLLLGLNAMGPDDGLAGPPGTLRAAVVISGARSAIEEPSYHRARSAQDLARIWLRHAGKEAAEKEYGFYYNEAGVPEVDFESYEVIAVFAGKGWNSAGIQALSIADGEERRVFRFDHKSYQTLGPDGGGQSVSAYGFFVLPRTEKPVVLEEDVQSQIGQPPVWKERARL